MKAYGTKANKIVCGVKGCKTCKTVRASKAAARRENKVAADAE